MRSWREADKFKIHVEVETLDLVFNWMWEKSQELPMGSILEEGNIICRDEEYVTA